MKKVVLLLIVVALLAIVAALQTVQIVSMVSQSVPVTGAVSQAASAGSTMVGGC